MSYERTDSGVWLPGRSQDIIRSIIETATGEESVTPNRAMRRAGMRMQRRKGAGFTRSYRKGRGKV